MKRVALIFGGKSVEHEISVRSAKTVLPGLIEAGFDVLLIGIDRAGVWQFVRHEQLQSDMSSMDDITNDMEAVYFVPGGKGQVRYLQYTGQLHSVDVVFPLVHGTGGEDGSMQGLLEIVDVPYVGCGVQASANCMDKVTTKKLLEFENRDVARYIVCQKNFREVNLKIPDYEDVVDRLGSPFFVKPARSGSSVGVSKVERKSQFDAAIELAFEFDEKILIEEAVIGREIECAVTDAIEGLQHEFFTTSVVGPGEIRNNRDFYSFEAKYVNEDDSEVIIDPQDFDPHVKGMLCDTARIAYMTLGCLGMARVDMFLTPDNRVVINEVNTIPGFTSISMYPKLFEHAGVPLPTLLQHLIACAEKEHKKKKARKTMRV